MPLGPLHIRVSLSMLESRQFHFNTVCDNYVNRVNINRGTWENRDTEFTEFIICWHARVTVRMMKKKKKKRITRTNNSALRAAEIHKKNERQILATISAPLILTCPKSARHHTRDEPRVRASSQAAARRSQYPCLSKCLRHTVQILRKHNDDFL